jgi:hypothetical protein
MPGLNRPLAFPELARLRSAEQSFNVKTQRMTSYQRAQVVCSHSALLLLSPLR